MIKKTVYTKKKKLPSKKQEKDKKILVLLDVHAILHRAYHALPDFASSKGEPTGALYGVSTMLLKIIKDLSPDYIIACYDLPKPTYRHEAYENYKAGRKATDEELISQIKRSRDLFIAFGIPMYDHEGFEADDILGTIVEELKDNMSVSIIIASGDMDTLQLVKGEQVQVYTLRKGIKDTILYNEKEVKERYGFKPTLLTDYKGLRGDPSDNIIGIKGIGEKGATELINQFGTIEEIYKKLNKNKKAFLEGGIKERTIKLLEENKEEALFSKMLATIRRDAPISFLLPKKTWKESFGPEKVQILFRELDFRALQARILELGGTIQTSTETEDETDSFQKKLFEDDIDSKELVKKTSIALWVLNSNITNPTKEDILQYTKSQSLTEAQKKIEEELLKNESADVFHTIEEPLIPIIDGMEKQGVCIDIAYLKKLSKEYHEKLRHIEKDVFKKAGKEFNLKSPKQLGIILFEDMNLKPSRIKKTATGQYSTAESELEKMRDLDPIIALILEYRALQKLLSTYIDAIPNLVASDGRLHTTFLQAGTTTGRMASKDPNIQNIPIKSAEGRKIRNAFVAGSGFVLGTFDYSQVELRIAAFMSGDEKLMSIFKHHEDVHTSVAAQVFDVPPEQVDKEMRRRAKVINFGILYGMGVNALQRNLGTDRKTAQEYLNEYFAKFFGLADYIERVKIDAHQHGYTETLFGRRRYFEGIRSKMPHIKAAAERMAINAPIQGTMADIVKIAMVRVGDFIEKQKLSKDVRMLLQIHDELLFEIKKEKVDAVVPEIKKIMESIVPLTKTNGVPIITTAEIGENWGEMKDYLK